MKNTVFGILLLFIGCTSQYPQPKVGVKILNEHRSVAFRGLDYAIISEINRDSTRDIWQSLLPVFKMPADTDLKNYQPVQPGRYQLTDSTVVFTPDTAFINGKPYFMRYYHFEAGQDVWDFIRNKKKLRAATYTDLIFR